MCNLSCLGGWGAGVQIIQPGLGSSDNYDPVVAIGSPAEERVYSNRYAASLDFPYLYSLDVASIVPTISPLLCNDPALDCVSVRCLVNPVFYHYWLFQ